MADDSLDLSRYPAPQELVPIASLTPDPTNARNHTANDARSIKALMKSLEKFGQRKPIVVDADGIVRAGNGLMEAASQLGWTHISITRADALKGAEAMEYALYDNRTAETSSWDNAILAAQLQEYASLGEGIPEPLWSNEELLAVQSFSKVEPIPSSYDAIAPDPEYLIVVTCVNEEEQRTLFTEWQSRGLDVRLMS